MKKPEEINYLPMGTAVLVLPPKSESGLILSTSLNLGLGLKVVKVGENCTKTKVGDVVMVDCAIFPLNVDGIEYWQISAEHEIFGKVINGGKVQQGDRSIFEPKDPTSHYNH